MKIISEGNSLISIDDDCNVIATTIAGIDDPGFIQNLINAGHREIEFRGSFVSTKPGFIKLPEPVSRGAL